MTTRYDLLARAEPWTRPADSPVSRIVAELVAEVERLQATTLFEGRVVDATVTARFTIQADSAGVTYPSPNARVRVLAVSPTPSEGP